MAGQALEAVSEINQGQDKQQANLSNAVFTERINESPSKSITTAELNPYMDLTFEDPYNAVSSNVIRTAEGNPGQENGLERTSQANPEAGDKSNKGPLAWMIDNPDNPVEHAIDKAWKDPYNEITKMGGHELLAKFDAKSAKMPFELRKVPESERENIIALARKHINPSNPISDVDNSTLSKYPEIQKLIQEFRTMNTDPKFHQAYNLRMQVTQNLDPAIEYRQAMAKWLTDQFGKGKRVEDGRSVTSASLALILESKSLQRYKYGYR